MQVGTGGVGEVKEDRVVMHDSASAYALDPQLPQLQGADEGWVVYVVHPDKGQFVINEGVVLVGEQQVVCGGARQGFYSAPVPVACKAKIRENDTHGLPNDVVVFPNIFMLAPVMRQLAEDAYDIAIFGPGEITDSNEIPEDVVVPMPPPRGNYYVPRRRAAPERSGANKKVVGSGVGTSGVAPGA